MVAINVPTITQSTSLPSQTPSRLPSIMSQEMKPNDSLNTPHSFKIGPVIILSVAALAFLIALAIFIFYKAKQKFSGPASPPFMQSKSGSDDRHNKLKPLKLLSEEKYEYANAFPDSQIQSKTHSFPKKPPGSLHLYRVPSCRQSSLTTVRRSRSLTPGHVAAFTFDDIPALCSPPSSSPKEIFEWIQSDSVLNARDGYIRAREDSRLLLLVPTPTSLNDQELTGSDGGSRTSSSSSTGTGTTKTTFVLVKEARDSMTSSSTLNRTQSLSRFRSQSPTPLSQVPVVAGGDATSATISSIPASPTGYESTYLGPSDSHVVDPSAQSSKPSGATSIPSLVRLLKESHSIGPLEQGTRWCSVWQTFEKQISWQGKSEKVMNENRGIRFIGGKPFKY